MIGLVRYGFLGYSDTNIPLSLLFLTAATTALFLFNLRLFNRGWKLPRPVVPHPDATGSASVRSRSERWKPS